VALAREPENSAGSLSWKEDRRKMPSRAPVTTMIPVNDLTRARDV
jgi:hypothetical protein